MSVPNNIMAENGEQFIPASQRPDGTWRKARRVKDGYVPQEEVPLYESKGKQFVSKKQEPVILPSGKVAHRPIPGLVIIQDETDKKASKKKSHKKVHEVTDIMEKIKLVEAHPAENKSKKRDKAPQESGDSNKTTETTDPQKKLKNLKKRLREVEALEEKIKSGTLAKPEPEQLAKIKRKNDLIMQIHELEKHLQ